MLVKRVETICVGAAVLVLSGCSAREATQRQQADTTRVAQHRQADTTHVGASPTAPVTFVNRVWVVAESGQVFLGDVRVFLSDGTLVMTSPHGTPAFGTWSDQDGRLTITEEGQKYPVDILELTQDTFRIRMHSPGEPVDIRFVPAKP